MLSSCVFLVYLLSAILNQRDDLTLLPTAEDVLRFAEARAQKKLSGPGDHQLTGISCLMMAVPWVLHNAHKDEETCVKSALEWLVVFLLFHTALISTESSAWPVFLIVRFV